MGPERDVIFGGEYPMQYADNILLSCTLETCTDLLTNVIPINSIIYKEN